MKFSVAAAAAVFAGVASASYANVTTVTLPCEITTTEVVTAYTTYCPESTTIVENSKTITVTAPGTVTITNCPCTRESVITTSTVTTVPVISGTPVIPTTVITPSSSAPVSTKSVTSSPVANVTTTSTVAQGGAAKLGFSGAAAGVLAAAVYFL
ncbi:uncharacterized protein SAPINGB_P005273 [Magnusiomyces paraingens]|uniref:Uncharacterized protein n=1 Tax=Magnusiomyces paraingens TaxID=2606893 RepID=A0A5E8C6D0_9ASCO|nr:uncharacterized protein SAPINGB_P005273 [Saprochaete ingens]VVT56786.1 unnamed protein product [Saprochaete ingens]